MSEKPLNELTPAEVAQQMAALTLQIAELDAAIDARAREMEALMAEMNMPKLSVGVYDPNGDSSAVIEPSPEAVTLAKHLFDSELSEKQERYCASVRQLFAAV